MLRVSEDGKNRRREGHIASYKQLHTSLIELQEAADRIFDRISERTAKESEKVVNLSKRIQNAKSRDYTRCLWIAQSLHKMPGVCWNLHKMPGIDQGLHKMPRDCLGLIYKEMPGGNPRRTLMRCLRATIDAIPHSKQTIVIRSSSRYPTNSNEEEDFHSLFGYKDGATGKGFPVAKLLVNGGLNREYGVDGTLELFQFFSETTSDFLPKEVHPKVMRIILGKEDRSSLILAKGEKKATLYKMIAHLFKGEVNTALKDSSPSLWYRRLGHMSEKDIQVLAKMQLLLATFIPPPVQNENGGEEPLENGKEQDDVEEGEQSSNEEELPESQLRRSTRERRTSSRYPQNEYMMVTNEGKPESFQEAQVDVHKGEWSKAQVDVHKAGLDPTIMRFAQKVGSGVIHSNGNAFVENLLEPPHYTYCSFLKRDNIAADSLLSPKHQALPPPPPSLLQSCSALPRLEGFSFRPSVVQSPKLQNTIPDLSKVPHITLSGELSFGVDDYQQKEKPETTGASSQVLPQLPPAPLLSHSLAETSFVQKHHTSTDSGATTTLVDNPKLIPPLPIVGFSPLPPVLIVALLMSATVVSFKKQQLRIWILDLNLPITREIDITYSLGSSFF
ncbi:hypothetical protein HHK36_006707 [Tetracentron sinense]|uniref:GAG-pre-integrase domain-containing protein n=1 Tax=Tetracentron sinense TaxID=13715 RepID=A0A834ZM08_TETSI|nr:hypothetical protein HHK36_006707 [Tetracentron sinense]